MIIKLSSSTFCWRENRLQSSILFGGLYTWCLVGDLFPLSALISASASELQVAAARSFIICCEMSSSLHFLCGVLPTPRDLYQPGWEPISNFSYQAAPQIFARIHFILKPRDWPETSSHIRPTNLGFPVSCDTHSPSPLLHFLCVFYCFASAFGTERQRCNFFGLFSGLYEAWYTVNFTFWGTAGYTLQAWVIGGSLIVGI